MVGDKGRQKGADGQTSSGRQTPAALHDVVSAIDKYFIYNAVVA